MSKTESGVTTTKAYTYDDIGQLISETTNGANAVSYSYDSNRNRTTTGGSQIYDTQDRLSSDVSWTYTYNRSGYLIKKTHKTNGSIVNYTYDNLGNLLKVTQTGKSTVDYIIDGEDRRIQRKVGGLVKESFIYLDNIRPIAQLDSTGNVVATFVYGTKASSPDLIVKGNVTYRVITDHLGSPLYIVNTSTNAVAQKITYDTWGRVLTDSNPGFQPFGFSGGLYDATTGLVRFGARDYDPSIGRWLYKDPIRFEGGWNLYAYVGNNPVNYIDPKGTDAQAVLIDGFHSGIQVDSPFGGEPSIIHFGPKDGVPTALAFGNLPVPSKIRFNHPSELSGTFPIPFTKVPLSTLETFDLLLMLQKMADRNNTMGGWDIPHQVGGPGGINCHQFAGGVLGTIWK